MDQLDVNNGVDWHMKEKEVMFSSDDILLKIRIAGIFHQELVQQVGPYAVLRAHKPAVP